VDVVGGDLLPVPEAAGGAVTILSVADGSVTMLLPSGTLITIGQGSRLTFGGCLITVLSAGADGAAIQLNGAA
jgi:hypothetical protein